MQALHLRRQLSLLAALLLSACVFVLDKQHLLDEANLALTKAVTDQGLSVEDIRPSWSLRGTIRR